MRSLRAAPKSRGSRSETSTGRTASSRSSGRSTPGKGGLVRKQTKGRKTRFVPILDELEPVLVRLSAGKKPEDPLLRGPRGGVLTTATVRDATNWDQIVVDLGLPNLTRHGLRHTGATWLADAGVPLHVLQRILGHASIETTKGYLHPDHRQLNEAAQLANQFLARPKTRQNRKEPPHAPVEVTRNERSPDKKWILIRAFLSG